MNTIRSTCLYINYHLKFSKILARKSYGYPTSTFIDLDPKSLLSQPLLNFLSTL